MKGSHYLYLVLMLISADMSAQNIGFIVMNDSDKVLIYKHALMNGDIVQTCDSAGRWIEFRQGRISRASIKGRDFIGMPVNTILTNRLHEVIARSPDYILTSYIDRKKPYLFVFDKEKKPVLKRTRYYNKGTAKKLQMIRKIKPFFGNCKELMEKLERNAAIKDGALFQNTSKISCR
jgi:hypothetical protein